MCLEYWHWSIDRYCPIDANEITTSGSGVPSSQDCSHVDHVLFNTLINRSLLSSWYSKRDRSQCSSVDSSWDCMDCVLFDNLINRSLLSSLHSKRDRSQCNGIDSLRDCVDCVLFDLLIYWLLVSILTPIANEIEPSGSEVDSSRDCSHVNCLIFIADGLYLDW